MSVDPVRRERYRQADNGYPKVALRHSQVYAASADIRGGMSIYAIIIAQGVPGCWEYSKACIFNHMALFSLRGYSPVVGKKRQTISLLSQY